MNHARQPSKPSAGSSERSGSDVTTLAPGDASLRGEPGQRVAVVDDSSRRARALLHRHLG